MLVQKKYFSFSFSRIVSKKCVVKKVIKFIPFFPVWRFIGVNYINAYSCWFVGFSNHTKEAGGGGGHTFQPMFDLWRVLANNGRLYLLQKKLFKDGGGGRE